VPTLHAPAERARRNKHSNADLRHDITDTGFQGHIHCLVVALVRASIGRSALDALTLACVIQGSFSIEYFGPLTAKYRSFQRFRVPAAGQVLTPRISKM